MSLIIANSYLSASINPLGAELSSLIRLRDREEYMWEANPEIWGGVAPILFPNTGVLRDAYAEFDGQRYPLPKHGFARDSEFEVVEHTAEHCTLRLTSNPITKTLFPFDFDFRVTFALDDHSLHVQYQITNAGDRPLPYSIGSHPAFRFNSEDVTRYRLRLDSSTNPTIAAVTEQGLVEPQDKLFILEEPRDIQITPSLFSADALVFLNNDIRSVTLLEDGEPRLCMSWDQTPHLGIWAKPNAPYVCIEPWQSYADSSTSTKNFYHKPGITTLGVGETDSDGYRIDIL